MREYLFRGKRTDNGEWVEGGLISIDLETCSLLEKKKYTHCIIEPNVEFYRGQIARLEFVIPETVGQFTGLTDKNGNKIFEGDIVKIDREINFISNSKENRELIIGVVEFSKKRFLYQIRNKKYSYMPLFRVGESDTNEVIGNIYDNPELLGAVSNG